MLANMAENTIDNAVPTFINAIICTTVDGNCAKF